MKTALNISRNRHGIYYVRLFIPKEFRLHFQHKREIKRSLRTDSKRAAIKMARAYRAVLDQFVAELQNMKFPFPDPKDILRVTQISGLFTLPNGARFQGQISVDHSDHPNAPEEERKSVQAAIEALGLPALATSPTTPLIPVASSVRLASVIDEFVQHKLGNGWTEGEHAHEQGKQRLGLLLEIVGDKPCSEITNQDAIHVWETLPKIPTNPNKGSLAKLATLSEKIAEAKRAKLPVWEKRNQAVHWELFVSLIKFAKKKKYILEDIIEDLTIKVSKKESKANSYKPFSDADLDKLIHGHVFLPEKASRTANHDYHFWLPLLAMYTGARLNELCQLLVEDIKKTPDGIWYIDITDEEQEDKQEKKSVKSEAGRRKVPIHSKLIELGFLEFISGKSGQIFSTGLSYAAKGKWGKNASRWFNGDSACKGYKQNCGFTANSGKVFHSFRKSFASKLINYIPVERLAQMIGHEQEYKTTFIYIDEIQIKTLKDDIEKLRYEIDLSHISYESFVAKAKK
ncbi:Phage integrase family protein [Methylomagnum ishizawai]|uniref:Phage integrase family protein n=1 Tax=Methylomagnum ishizawai TaxID=1760988 RepID=A0A1Y6CVY7_9GAMM|nr:site-specific integrase [Methylomagnum ishizawai]SMF94400.1 Phage integrase family protein [Methylomagnum ishizawai]